MLRKNDILSVLAVLILLIFSFYFAYKSDRYIETARVNDSCPGLQLKTKCFQLERAATNEGRLKGLSERDSLSPDTAMLFVFDSSDEQCMWMKDMRFNVDIVWLNEKSEVIKIEQNISPNTYPQTFCADNTKYVLEFNQGVIASSGIKIGDKLQL